MRNSEERRFVRAARRGRPEIVSEILGRWIEESSWPTDRLFAIRDAILQCSARSAPALLDGLRRLAKDHHAGFILQFIVYGSHGVGHMVKILSVLTMAGFPLASPTQIQFEKPPIRRHHELLQGLYESAHARIEAYRLEPDPVAAIARPWWRPFYGHDASRFPGDLTIWQRFITPIIAPHNNTAVARNLFFAACFLLGALVGLGVFQAISQ